MATKLLLSSSQDPEIQNWLYPELDESKPHWHIPLFFQDLF
jgi:hypothetical protein